jgi:hypothetical protein
MMQSLVISVTITHAIDNGGLAPAAQTVRPR